MFLTEQKWKKGIAIEDNKEQSKTTITISDELKQDLFSKMRYNATTLTTDEGMRRLLQKYAPAARQKRLAARQSDRLIKQAKTSEQPHAGGRYKRKTRKTRKTRKSKKTKKSRKTRKSKKTKKSRKTRKSRK